ncbi:MAG: QueT transporter family protein [Butyrivibrio sp.]|nr:QueT transporter family protein [Butyrivibrio sp.]
MNQNRSKAVLLAQAGLIAALYVALTYLSAYFNLASGAIQVRISEALTVLPFFTVAGVPGVTLGCFLANLLIGSPWPDVVFGTFATLLGALGSYALKKNRILVSVPPVISNMVIVPLILKFAYSVPGELWYFAITVGIGEIVSCVVFGQVLITALMPLRHRIFGDWCDK